MHYLARSYHARLETFQGPVIRQVGDVDDEEAA